MRTFAPVLACTLAVVLCGCTSSHNSTATASAASTQATSAASSDESERSPIPAFHGGGSNWRIDLQADGGVRHTARIFRDGHWLNATLMLRAATPTDDPNAFAFDGTLFAPGGDTPLRVDITRDDCKGREGAAHPDAVRVSVQGSALLEGCGQVTPY
ncbi:MAG: hypothetical protein JSS41_04040 [Proteobacteria bacterium]|nr:hypothetical protein [Pseudomonadota bacterium]MBS0463992.1 hypothetical protein [Pseudomonadota bacterium]